jgi:hypothetical protein
MDITPLALLLGLGAIAFAIAGAGVAVVAPLVVIALVIEAFVLGGRAFGLDQPPEAGPE